MVCLVKSKTDSELTISQNFVRSLLGDSFQWPLMFLAASLEIGTAHDTIHDPQLSSTPCYLA